MHKAGKTALLILSCSLFMGNEGCDSEEAIKRGRILRKSSSSLGISSSNIDLGDGINIPVEDVINGQYLTELQDSEYFASVDRLGGVQGLAANNKNMIKNTGMNFRPLSANNTAGECTNDLEEVILTGNATDFELGNEFGVSIGFGVGGVLGGIIDSADFNIKKMTMGLDMHAYQPLSGTHLTSAHHTGVKTDFGGGLGLNILGIKISPRAVFRRPVVDVIRDTLSKTLKKLGAELEAQELWSARVFEENDSHIIINAGSRHGLKKGDALYVSNMKYFWDGQPCKSRLNKQLNTQDRDNPVAKVIIETTPSSDVVVARVFEESGIDIQEGARVYILNLAGSQDPETDPLPDAPNPEEYVPKKKQRVDR